VIAEPMLVAEQQIYVTGSIGVSCFPDNATTPQELLRQAEAAMMRAKRDGRNAVCAFSNDQSEELRVRLALGSRLRIAIRDSQLQLHFQPQISGLDWQVLGFEALARWQDPELGVVMPKVFVQAAEELGLIMDLGRFVLTEACRQARVWIDAGARDFSIAVNISPLQLIRPEFASDVGAALAKFNIPPGCIELELTESVMAENVERMLATMQALKALGVRLALDDFGTGYSSMNYLRRFPIDCLKIDQSFVRDVTTDAGAAGICRAVITLAHQLGMRVMAEGVETAAQVGYLKRNECDLFQGYYFSKPVTAEKALEMLRHRYLAHTDIGETQQQQTLLLVDDEINILNALGRALRRDGYRILTATCADEALEILGREEIDVIVSDQRMPGMTGTELLSKVKEMHPGIVRIVLSGYTDLDAITDAINQGAIYKFLTKPWNDDELRTQIRDAFRMGHSRKHAQPGAERRIAALPKSQASGPERRAARDTAR
jgi:EAL domain-containing protein (putative c-di-GMP-specific phosphodiesterase class I)/CheY-like chemotaxis protein